MLMFFCTNIASPSQNNYFSFLIRHAQHGYSLYVSMLWVKCLISIMCMAFLSLQPMPIFPYIIAFVSLFSYYFG